MTAAAAYRVVIFDCDSTLTRIEGIDELARMQDREPEIAALTAAAMDGRVPLEDVYGRRLALLRPAQRDVERLGRRYVEELVPGTRETFAALRAAGVSVHVVSAGVRPAVVALGYALGVDAAHVHAVDLEFDAAGGYRGFDQASPLTRSGGKREVCAGLIARFGRCAAVGDGITDLEMQEAGADFIGFGGVVVREAVRRAAARYVEAPGLDAVLPLLLS